MTEQRMCKADFYKWVGKWQSKPSKIDKVVYYINQQLKDSSAVGIYMPKLSERQWRQLREHFECRREFLGYVRFARLGDKR